MSSITVIAAFHSRAQTTRLYQSAKQCNIPCGIVNTPREAAVGCGISVSFDPSHFSQIQRLIYGRSSDGLIGFFRVTRIGNKTTVDRI